MRKITKKEQEELANIYNGSDYDALIYMEQFCDEEQKKVLKRLFELNKRVDEHLSSEEIDEYYEKKWELLSSFGIKSVMGDAYVPNCENCSNFYTCDNNGIYEECLPDYKHWT